MRPHSITAACILTATIASMMLACRDGVEPYQPVDRPQNPDSPVRLTYSPDDDRTPAWSPNGDTVYYSAESESEEVFPAWTLRKWILMKQERVGSAAEIALPNVQSPDSRAEHWLTSPTPDPGGSSLAFIEISELWAPHTCPLSFGPPGCSPQLNEEQSRQPPVREIKVIARRLEATHALNEDESVTIQVAGKEGVQSAVIHYHPFQRLFADEGAVVFRASWAPDGERLVFSDGLSLYTWRVGDGTAEPILNTEDGAWPAWSPDGEWIAFTRIERAGSTDSFCRYTNNMGAVICTQERIDYIVGPSVLSLVRPDGSDLLELGEGSEPAWSPDGASLVFRRGNMIWSSGIDGTNAEAIPGTEGGREPAVSADGSYLALAILSDDGDYDIWTIALEP